MENNLINAFNEMNNTNYSSLEEIQEMYSKAEIFNRGQNMRGFTDYCKNTSRIGNFRE